MMAKRSHTVTVRMEYIAPTVLAGLTHALIRVYAVGHEWRATVVAMPFEAYRAKWDRWRN